MKKNKYSDIIRHFEKLDTYEDILSMGLSTTNVENVVELVVEILAHIECDPSPKLTFGNELYRDHKLVR